MPAPLPTFARYVAMTRDGLVLGFNTLLARFDDKGELALELDRERILAFLSIAHHSAASLNCVDEIASAARYWQNGDKALANIRLATSNLPRLEDTQDALRLCLAETLIDAGLPPRSLMHALGLSSVLIQRSDLGPR